MPDGIALTYEELQYRLHKAEQDSEWWWHQAQRLEQELSSKRGLKLSSPLTSNEVWMDAPSTEGWYFKQYATFCPCCKRPLDFTLVDTDDHIVDLVVESDIVDLVVERGTMLRCVSLPNGCDSLPVFESCTSFEVVGRLSIGSEVIASGPTIVKRGCPMLPLSSPYGAVDSRCFELDDSTKPICSNLDASAVAEDAARLSAPASKPRHAYCAALWGANAGYVLGAAVLGARLQELSVREDVPDRVLLHTDDVPRNFLDILARHWTLQLVDYIDGVQALYGRKGTIFDGVFTKLCGWSLVQYDKVLLLDIDVIPLIDPQSLFDLQAPAAMVRGNRETQHGTSVDGRSFFAGEGHGEYSWFQGGGINAGVILLQPDQWIFERMLAEVYSDLHPEHIAGAGPEQDYLTRFFASAPWHAINVRWNFQIHHVLFALENVLQGQANTLRAIGELSSLDRSWRPPRLATELKDIGMVHFSGDVKLWHLYLDVKQRDDGRRAVEHSSSYWASDSEFAEHLLRECCEGYTRWVERAESADEYERFDCVLGDAGVVSVVAGDTTEDVTPIVDEAVAILRGAAGVAVEAWHVCAKRLFSETPDLLEDLKKPSAPDGAFLPGTRVEVQRDGGREEGWYPGMVASVHADGCYVIRFDCCGAWGDTERRVSRERLRPPLVEPQ